MRNYILILVSCTSIFLSACNDHNDGPDNTTNKPPVTNCKIHCAP